MNPSLQIPDDGMTLEELRDFVGQQMKRLNLVLKSIDGLNIVDIKFELKEGAYLQFNRKGLHFNNGTKDTVLVDVNGNLTVEGVIEALAGHIGGFTIEDDRLFSDSGNGIIQGGTIIGSEIKTAESTYPRVELSSINNLFQALASSTNSVQIVPDLSGNPSLRFVNGSKTGFMQMIGSVLAMLTPPGGTNIQIGSGNDLLLTANSNINLNSNSLTINGDTGYTGTFSTGTQTVLVTNGIIVGVV